MRGWLVAVLNLLGMGAGVGEEEVADPTNPTLTWEAPSRAGSWETPSRAREWAAPSRSCTWESGV